MTRELSRALAPFESSQNQLATRGVPIDVVSPGTLCLLPLSISCAAQNREREQRA